MLSVLAVSVHMPLLGCLLYLLVQYLLPVGIGKHQCVLDYVVAELVLK